jgi:hypothetical protein
MEGRRRKFIPPPAVATWGTDPAKMDRIKISRAVRISAATLCLAACALTLALWPLSYFRRHEVTVAWSPPRLFILTSEFGRLEIASFGVRDHRPGIGLRSYPSRDTYAGSWLYPKEATFGFWLVVGPSAFKTGPNQYVRSTHIALIIPDWFVALATGGMGIALLKRWHRRFTLRMLLAVTTVLAVVLGLMVYKR